MRLVLAVLLLAACGGRSPAPRLDGIEQECRLRLGVEVAWPADWLIVVDNSPAMLPHLPRVASLLGATMDELERQLAADERWRVHVGVVTADPADGGRLRRGCGLGGGGAYIDVDASSGWSNLAPGHGLAQTLACLLPDRIGAAEQRPLEMAWRALEDPLEANAGFFTSDGGLVILWITAADYGEDAVLYGARFSGLRSGGQPVPIYDPVLESLSNGDATLHAVVSSAHWNAELPLDATDGTPLVYGWLQGDGGDRRPPCLQAAPLDPSHPDCVVEDHTHFANGHEAVTEVPSCLDTRWIAPCWELTPDLRCQAPQIGVSVRRPPLGVPENTTTQVSCACAAGNPVGN